MDASSLIEDFTDHFKNQKEQVQEEFKPLKHRQLNWRPAEGKWSIIECIEHLNIVGRHYYRQSKSAIEKAEKEGFDFSKEYRPTWIGNYLYKSMHPDENNRIRNKMKTMSSMQPDPSNINAPMALDEFMDRQDSFAELFERMRYIDMGRVRVKTFLGNFLKLKLGDAIRFTEAHQARHLLQAHNVLKTEGFPGLS